MTMSEEGLRLNISSRCMEFKDKMTLVKYVVESDEKDEDSDEKEEEEKQNEVNDINLNFEFSNQSVIRSQVLNDIKIKLVVQQDKELDIPVKITQVADPPQEVRSKATIKLINKLIYDAIQEVQRETKIRSTEQIYEYVKKLDKELDEQMEQCFKMKDRNMKKEIMQDIQECKDKTR